MQPVQRSRVRFSSRKTASSSPFPTNPTGNSGYEAPVIGLKEKVTNLHSRLMFGGKESFVTVVYATELQREPERHRIAEGPALALLTFAVLLVHGFHPLADDGAVYVTGIKKLVDPGLFRTDAVF